FVVRNTRNGNGHWVGHASVHHVHFISRDYRSIGHGNGGKSVVHFYWHFGTVLHKVHSSFDGVVSGSSGTAQHFDATGLQFVILTFGQGSSVQGQFGLYRSGCFVRFAHNDLTIVLLPSIICS